MQYSYPNEPSKVGTLEWARLQRAFWVLTLAEAKSEQNREIAAAMIECFEECITRLEKIGT